MRTEAQRDCDNTLKAVVRDIRARRKYTSLSLAEQIMYDLDRGSRLNKKRR